MILRYKANNKLDQYELDFRTILKKRINKKAEEYADIRRAAAAGQKKMSSEEYELKNRA